MTVPGYPVAGTHTKYYGGTQSYLFCRKQLFARSGFILKILDRAKLLVINYPNSPTGKLATEAFFEKVVQFAKDNNVVVVQDAAHILLTFDGRPTLFWNTTRVILS